MSKKILKLCAVIPALLMACNKDNDIVVDIPAEDELELNFTVVEYLPAPGQFINEPASGYSNETTMEAACSYALKRLQNYEYVSLGAFGGSLTVRIDHKILNSGGYDFCIAGNAIDTSNEPGIVWVMEDKNGNGQPDDNWYELKGSDYGKPGYQRNYWVEYFRPDGPQKGIIWTDSEGESGEIEWVGTYHSQEYYFPSWVKGDSYRLTGSRLPSQLEQNPLTGVWANKPFAWGYVDNKGEDFSLVSIKGKGVALNYFRISDAVDSEGNAVTISGADFIKVQTAVNNFIGVIGENSTDVCGFFRVP